MNECAIKRRLRRRRKLLERCYEVDAYGLDERWSFSAEEIETEMRDYEAELRRRSGGQQVLA